ncbi:MAG TPA: TolC family protein [Gammaproteobacteria bacterium]|nr:TolC family protein [Gammaproteobacteria bacterium]
MRRRLSTLAMAAALAVAALVSAPLPAQTPSRPSGSDLLAPPPARELGAITLEQALDEAHRANAKLPVAQLKVQQALARERQARGAFYPKLSIDGDVHGGTPQRYASDDALLRVLAQTPLYTGGELRAGLAQRNAETDSLRAGYRMSVRDVDHAVRLAYGQMLHAESTLAFRQRGIERLAAYLAVVQARQTAGQGVGADVLEAQQRLATARADIAAATRERDEGRLTLNDLLGREPEAPLSLAPLPVPVPPSGVTGRPWLATPDVAQSEADVRAGQAAVQAALAGRKPHITLEADAGTQPVLGPSDMALLNNGEGSGAEVTINFSVPFWDNGVFKARVAEADAALTGARRQQVAVERSAHLAWAEAATDLSDLYDEYQARSTAAAAARDAYLQTESLYRGGQGTALAVLDAYDAWIQANQSLLDVTYAYRVAQADLYRWGSP